MSSPDQHYPTKPQEQPQAYSQPYALGSPTQPPYPPQQVAYQPGAYQPGVYQPGVYQPGVYQPQPVAYQPQPGAYQPQQIIYSQQAIQVPATVIVNSQQIKLWSSYPQNMTCPHCNKTNTSKTRKTPGIMAHAMCAVLCFIGCFPCNYIPYCIDSCKDTIHYCSHCNRPVGRAPAGSS